MFGHDLRDGTGPMTTNAIVPAQTSEEREALAARRLLSLLYREKANVVAAALLRDSAKSTAEATGHPSQQ